MTLDSLLTKYNYTTRCPNYALTGKTSEYLQYIDKAPFFISPDINLIKESSADSKAKVLIVSAPGAVGKTTFAKYLSYAIGAMYWDLSKLTIGTGTFQGSILAAIGLTNLSAFMRDLAESKAIIAFDAFDEAEMISGRRMLGEFVFDIASSVKESDTPCAVLFARTTTAQFLASFCETNNISFDHYEIGYFSRSAAEEFVKQSCERDIPIPVIDGYFSVLEKYSFCDKSFTGYAPTLQVIAKHIASESNTMHVINGLANKSTISELICKIMHDLLEREQGIVVNALKSRCADKYPEFTDWNAIYTPEEQVARILSLLIFEQVEYTDWTIAGLPAGMVDDYADLLLRQVNQHPFLFEAKDEYIFAGPAFKDFTLAYSLLHTSIVDTANLYFEEGNVNNYLPSTVFFDCYIFMANHDANLASIDLLYKSFCAHNHAGELGTLSIYEEVRNEETDTPERNYVVSFGVNNVTKETLIIPTQDNDVIHFESVFNVTIDAPHLVVELGTTTAEARVSNSTIVCKQIIWKSRKATIEVALNHESLIVTEEKMQGKTLFDCIVNGTLKVSTSNISNYYKLLPYSFDYTSEKSIEDLAGFAHRVRCILLYFRTHGKDTLGKTADFVRNIIVGSSKPKQRVLDFLMAAGIAYEEEHLLKINMELLGEAGINFSIVMSAEITAYKKLFNDFLSYSEGKQK